MEACGTFAGTAQADVDYEPVSGTILFGDGETAATIAVTLVSDRIDEEEKPCTSYSLRPTDWKFQPPTQ